MTEYFEAVDFNKPQAAQEVAFTSTSTHDQKHGRVEERDYAVTGDVQWLIDCHPNWKTIRSIGMVEATRQTKEKTTVERRYFVSSLEADPNLFAKTVRGHWGIENSLHYVLDVTLGEDDAA